ncbi:VOC family protein [Colwellia sp. E150_009]
MKFLHSMIRVSDLEASLDFYVNKLGLVEVRRKDVPEGKFTLIFLATAIGEAEIELTHNWGSEEVYDTGRNFGHLAFEVDDIYETCQHLQNNGVTINRPPRCGYMAFIKSPDNISIELLQKGEALAPKEPWLSMENTGTW